MNQNIKNKLMSKIEDAIEEKAIKYGIMGSESVNISLTLSDEELEAFRKIDLDEHYTFDIEGNEVTISYTEGR